MSKQNVALKQQQSPPSLNRYQKVHIELDKVGQCLYMNELKSPCDIFIA